MNLLTNIFFGFFGLILFFLPGILLSYILFPKTDIIRRSVYSVALAVSVATIIGVFLHFLNMLTSLNTILVMVFLNVVLMVLGLNKKYETIFNKDFWYLLFFSLIGAAWRIWFKASLNNFGDAYKYSGEFIGGDVPSLGFYTGIAADHSEYIGLRTAFRILDFLNMHEYLSVFFITFAFLGFIYLIFSEYRNRKLAYVGIALMALGPIEIFHSTLTLVGHSLSYISLFSLFLLFKSKSEDKNIFWVTLALIVAMMFTYYTASMVILLASGGFILALLLKNLIKSNNFIGTLKKSLRDKKILCFLLIIIILASYFFIFSDMLSYSADKFQASDTGESISNLVEYISDAELEYISDTGYKLIKYRDPTFLGLSAIRWQIIFFFSCGLTFILYVLRKRIFSEKNLDLLLCLIPVLIVSYAFFHANFPTRIFDYFAFFGLLTIKLPKKYFKIFFILSFIFILVTSFYVANDKKIFFDIPDKEIEGVLWIKDNLKGKIFSDQSFINHLILNEYYNVTGAWDKDPVVHKLFYQNNCSVFLGALSYLRTNLNVDYIVITKRMREQYILMLDFPQKHLINIGLYEDYLIKIYDNNAVSIYKLDYNFNCY